jgi:hypothetical protein
MCNQNLTPQMSCHCCWENLISKEEGGFLLALPVGLVVVPVQRLVLSHHAFAEAGLLFSRGREARVRRHPNSWCVSPTMRTQPALMQKKERDLNQLVHTITTTSPSITKQYRALAVKGSVENITVVVWLYHTTPSLVRQARSCRCCCRDVDVSRTRRVLPTSVYTG